MNTPLPLLYSFRRCPYAMRARMAIYAAGIAVQTIEVSLKDKPKDLLKHSPKGTVPVVITASGKVIDQSRDIMQWALKQADPDNWLLQNHTLKQQQMTQLVDSCDAEFKPWLDKYKYFNRYPEQSQLEYRQQAETFLRKLETNLSQHNFLVDEAMRFADVAIFPFVRQFAGVEPQWFTASPYGHLQQWLQRCVDAPLFSAIMAKPASSSLGL